MKILFYDWALHSIGGGQKFNCKIAEYLAKQGHEIDILTLFPVNKKKLEDYYSVDISKINIIPLYEKNNIPPTILKLLVSTKISKLSEKYGVFFNADAQEIINPKAKYNIMYCHFFEPKWYRPSRGFIDWLKLSLIYLLKTLKGNYSKKYYVYCNSEYTKNWLHKLWKINLDNINVIYPPVDIPSKTIFKKENIILSTGRISPDKNYEFVIEVFKQVLKQSSENSLKNYKLYICGKSDDVGYLNKLKSLSKGLSIEFKTNLSDKQLKDIYKKAKIFIQAKGIQINESKYPGLLEHFGMTTAEAMSYGCVPIVLNKGGYKEIVDSETGFKFNTKNEAVTYLLKLIQNPTLISKMSKAGIKRAKIFSLKKMQKQIDDVIKSLKLH